MIQNNFGLSGLSERARKSLNPRAFTNAHVVLRAFGSRIDAGQAPPAMRQWVCWEKRLRNPGDLL
jgi:hypothetical protein